MPTGQYYSTEGNYLAILANAPKPISLREIDHFLKRPSNNEPYIHKRIIEGLVEPGFVEKCEEPFSPKSRKRTVTKYRATHKGLIKFLRGAYKNGFRGTNDTVFYDRNINDYLKLIRHPFVWEVIKSCYFSYAGTREEAKQQSQVCRELGKKPIYFGNEIPRDIASTFQHILFFVYYSAIVCPKHFEIFKKATEKKGVLPKPFINLFTSKNKKQIIELFEKHEVTPDLGLSALNYGKIVLGNECLRIVFKNQEQYEEYLPKLKKFYKEKLWSAEINFEFEKMKNQMKNQNPTGNEVEVFWA